ncbi:MAG: molybdopterin-dependent oxidoreductase [Candidatus Hodarchaeota archaeon]
MNSLEKLSIKKRFGTCSKDCYGSCVFQGVWNDDAPERNFLYAKPSKTHPFTDGFFCSKLNHREELIYHPKRLKKSFIRDGPKGENNFKPIILERALDKIKKKVSETIKKYGSTSIIAAFSAGNYGLLSRYAPLRFFGKIGAKITYGGICNEGGCAGITKLFGTYSTTNPFQLMNISTKLIVVWGSDLTNRNIHAYHLIKKTIKKGTRLVVIDSQFTHIAEKSDLFIHTYPGTDYLLAQLIIKYLISSFNHDKEFLMQNVDNYKSLIEEVLNIDESRILAQLGDDIQSINNFVKLLVENKHHTIFNVGFGVQKDYYGGRIIQAIALIQIILGNLGKPGTGLIYSQSDFNNRFIPPLLEYITQSSKHSAVPGTNLINLGQALMSEDYKMLFIYNFNPASSLPNQNQIRYSLSREDLFVVVQELFFNETTKYANIVIPSKFDLESHDLITPYYIPGISINEAGPCPYSDCLSNYEFYQRLAWKLGWSKDTIFHEDEKSIIQNCLKLLPSNIQKNIKTQGYHVLFNQNDLPFKDLSFPTSNGKIKLSGSYFQFENNKLFEQKENEFLLISPSHKFFIHSQLGQINPQYLDVFKKVFLSKIDIENLGLEIGEEVLVSNEYGKSKYILGELQSLKKGIALIYSGSPLGSKRNLNVNFLTPDIPEESGLSGAYNSAIVSIKKLQKK